MKRATDYELKVTYKTYYSETPTELTVTYDRIPPCKVLEYTDFLEQSVYCIRVQIKPNYEVEE